MKPVFEVAVLSPDNLIHAVVAAWSGNSYARMLVSIVFDWIAQMGKKSMEEKPLCLNCEAVCNDDPSWSIAILLPFAADKGEVVVTGICPDCMARRDIKNIITGHFLKLCGGGTVLQEGTS